MPDATGDAAIRGPPKCRISSSGQTRGARSLLDQDQPADDAQEDAEPAHILSQDIAYVRGWAHAARAAATLARALHDCGLTDALPHLRAEVNTFGVGIVELGRITPDTAYALAALLAETRTSPKTAKEDTHHGSAA